MGVYETTDDLVNEQVEHYIQYAAKHKNIPVAQARRETMARFSPNGALHIPQIDTGAMLVSEDNSDSRPLIWKPQTRVYFDPIGCGFVYARESASYQQVEKVSTEEFQQAVEDMGDEVYNFSVSPEPEHVRQLVKAAGELDLKFLWETANYDGFKIINMHHSGDAKLPEWRMAFGLLFSLKRGMGKGSVAAVPIFVRMKVLTRLLVNGAAYIVEDAEE